MVYIHNYKKYCNLLKIDEAMIHTDILDFSNHIIQYLNDKLITDDKLKNFNKQSKELIYTFDYNGYNFTTEIRNPYEDGATNLDIMHEIQLSRSVNNTDKVLNMECCIAPTNTIKTLLVGLFPRILFGKEFNFNYNKDAIIITIFPNIFDYNLETIINSTDFIKMLSHEISHGKDDSNAYGRSKDYYYDIFFDNLLYTKIENLYNKYKDTPQNNVFKYLSKTELNAVLNSYKTTNNKLSDNLLQRYDLISKMSKGEFKLFLRRINPNFIKDVDNILQSIIKKRILHLGLIQSMLNKNKDRIQEYKNKYTFDVFYNTIINRSKRIVNIMKKPV